jgi:hypothetical protein
MEFKFLDAEAVKRKFETKTSKKDKTIEDVREIISRNLLKMLDGNRKNRSGKTISTTNKVLRKGSNDNTWVFQVSYGTVRVFGGELTATSEQQAKEKLKVFAEEIRTGKGLDAKVDAAIKSAMEAAKERGEKAAAKRKMNKAAE